MSHESEPTDVDRSDCALQRELRRYGEELDPEAIEPLIGLWARRVKGMSEDRIAEWVAEQIEEPEIAIWAKNYKRPEPSDVRCPLRVVLDRHAGSLRPGAVEALFHAWRLPLNSLPIPTIAGEVSRRLASPEYAEYLRSANGRISAEESVHTVLARYADILIPGAVEVLSRHWAVELSRLSAHHLVVEAIALRLSLPAFHGFIKPGCTMPLTGQDALREALARRHDLRPRAAGELLRLWTPLMSHLPPARVAGLVEERLASPACSAYLNRS